MLHMAKPCHQGTCQWFGEVSSAARVLQGEVLGPVGLLHAKAGRENFQAASQLAVIVSPQVCVSGHLVTMSLGHFCVSLMTSHTLGKPQRTRAKMSGSQDVYMLDLLPETMVSPNCP